MEAVVTELNSSPAGQAEPRRHLMVCVDNNTNRSTSAALALALKHLNKETDKLFLINVYTSWDYLNEEKNAGRLALAQFEQLSRYDDINVQSRQIESSSPQQELCDVAVDLEISAVYIGENAFGAVADDSNFVLRIFSSLKRYVTGSYSDYLRTYLNPNIKLFVVPESISNVSENPDDDEED